MKALLVHLAMLLAATPLSAQSDTTIVDTTRVESIVAGTLKIEQATQRAQDAWGVERSSLQARYVAQEANVRFLMGRKANDERRLAELRDGIADLRQRMAELQRSEAAARNIVQTIEGRLEQSVHGDLPFLVAERERRLSDLRSGLASTESAPAELLRRLLEALQFEAAYGGSTDVTRQRLAVGADSVSAEVLRIGRLALFWRTSDGKRIGRYDPASRAWVELPSKYKQGIGEAIEMASHARPSGVVTLPMGRIQL
jgi:hypothetical protein